MPGLSQVDSTGERVYLRPRGKSGGHGVGWSEITPYKFTTCAGWDEKPVSIADPDGTEIDAKFASDEEGDLKIILAPILRFSDFPVEVSFLLKQLEAHIINCCVQSLTRGFKTSYLWQTLSRVSDQSSLGHLYKMRT